MKEVVIYTMNKEVVHTSKDVVEVQSWLGLSDICTPNMEDFFDKEELSSVDINYWDVKEFCWKGGEKVFAAFDPELLELIGCMKSELNLYKANASEYQAKYKKSEFLLGLSEKTLQGFKDMTFWEAIKWSFSKLKIKMEW